MSPMWHSVTKSASLLSKIPPCKNGTQDKWHLTTTLLVFWSTGNTLLIKPTFIIRRRRVIRISPWSGKKSTLKCNDHEFESYNKFKHFLLKMTQLSPWQITFAHFFFRRCTIFVRHHFCGCHICLFNLEYLSCAIFVGCIWWLLNCNYLLFYQQFQERPVTKHEIKVV